MSRMSSGHLIFDELTVLARAGSADHSHVSFVLTLSATYGSTCYSAIHGLDVTSLTVPLALY